MNTDDFDAAMNESVARDLVPAQTKSLEPSACAPVSRGAGREAMINPRVHYIGTTIARGLVKSIRAEDDQIWVAQRKGEPEVVLVPYKLYLQIQEAAENGAKR